MVLVYILSVKGLKHLKVKGDNSAKSLFYFKGMAQQRRE